MLVELPVLIAVAAEPAAAVIVPFIGETDGNTVFVVAPQLLDQSIVELALPLAHEKCLNGRAALQELGTIAPAAVLRIGQGNACGVARIPGILCHADLPGCCLDGEGRQRWT